MTKPMDLWSPAPPLVPAFAPSITITRFGASAVPAQRPPSFRGVPYEPTADVESHGVNVTYHAITRMDTYAGSSFEELRLKDRTPEYVFYPPQPSELATTTLLERDVMRALGDVALNEPLWWTHRHDNAAWKRKKREIAMRVARATLQDAAAHVLTWMTPISCEIAKTTTAEKLKLSLLVDKWPVEFADVASVDGAGHVGGASRFPGQVRELTNGMPNPCDHYLVFAWAMLRGLCKRDDAAWPSEWGTSPCSCWNMRSLVDATADRCVDALERLISEREGGLDILPEDVPAILLAGDDAASEWLVTTLFDAAALIRTDMATAELWATRHLLSLISDHGLARVATDGVGISPAPFPNAFIVDGTDSPEAPKLLVGEELSPRVVEFAVERDQVTLRTALDSTFDGGALEHLLSSLLPGFAKTNAKTNTTSSCVEKPMDPGTFATPTWIGMPERPKLALGRRSPSAGGVLPKDKWTPTRVIVDVETISIPTKTNTLATSDWCYNAPMQVMDGVEFVATAVICMRQNNISAPELQIRSLLDNYNPPLPKLIEELYVRPAMSSSCCDVNAGITSVSAYPGRAVVLPPTIQYRITNAKLLDATKPGSVTVMRVSLVSPQCTTSRSDIEAMLQEAPEIPEWLEDLQLKPFVKHLSVEEERLAHYKHDCHPDARKWEQPKRFSGFQSAQGFAGVHAPSGFQFAQGFAPVQSPQASFSNEQLRRHEVHTLELKTLAKISELTNVPQWWETCWTEGSSARREWEKQLESFYLHERLASEVLNGYKDMMASFSAQTADGESKSEDDSESSANGGNDDGDAFVEVARLFFRILMVREAHRGFVSMTNRGKNKVNIVVDLVQQCRKAATLEAQAQIVSEFIGAGYPAEPLLSQMTDVWDRINDRVAEWMARVAQVVESRRPCRTDSAPGGLFSPIEGACVLDGGVAQVVKADLVQALEPLLCEALGTTADTATELCLVDPTCTVQVRRQSLPTFSVPRTGSIDERLAATIVQEFGGDSFEQRVNQWIPSDVAVDVHGEAKFLTYISNIFPRANRGLYKAIDAVTTGFVPVFEKLLSDMKEPARGPFFWDRYGKVVKDEIVTPPQAPQAFSMRGRVVQMAVEVIEIDLNPEQPHYRGDVWCQNSSKQQLVDFGLEIIATGVYFARVDNVTHPRMSYRDDSTQFGHPIKYVDGYTDRCLVFSNEMEHKMEPFELIDASKPGTVLMVKLHMVNPKIPVLSTANVQPSQHDWIVDYTLGDVTRFFNLPTEVHEVIESMLKWDGLRPWELQSALRPGTGFGVLTQPVSPGTFNPTTVPVHQTGFGPRTAALGGFVFSPPVRPQEDRQQGGFGFQQPAPAGFFGGAHSQPQAVDSGAGVRLDTILQQRDASNPPLFSGFRFS